ncbi:MAG: KH domain-containing protein [Desulfovibrio sp.]|nr:KH domain-containing protein [Desulfovibrio sp.]
MKTLLEYIAKALVDRPEAVEVVEHVREHGTVLELVVDKEDVGKVVGRQGRTARAMRSVLAAASLKARHRTSLEIRE